VNAEAGEDHSGNVAGAKEEIEIVGLEGDVLDGDDGRRAGGKTKASEGGIIGFETGMRKIGRVGEGPVSGEDDAADEESEEERGGCEEQRLETQV
jgi:hypothetical protein